MNNRTNTVDFSEQKTAPKAENISSVDLKGDITSQCDLSKPNDIKTLLSNLRTEYPNLTTKDFVQSIYAIVYNLNKPDDLKVVTNDNSVFDFKDYSTAGFSMIRYLDSPDVVDMQLESTTKLLDKVYTGFSGSSIRYCLDAFLAQKKQVIYSKSCKIFLRDKNLRLS